MINACDVESILAESGGAGTPDLGRGRSHHPADSLAIGTIADKSVPCIDTDRQVASRPRYESCEEDRADMLALAEAGLIAAEQAHSVCRP